MPRYKPSVYRQRESGALLRHLRFQAVPFYKTPISSGALLQHFRFQAVPGYKPSPTEHLFGSAGIDVEIAGGKVSEPGGGGEMRPG